MRGRLLLVLMVLLQAPMACAADAPFVDNFGKFDAARWRLSDGWSDGPMWLNDWRRSQLTFGPSGMVDKLDKNPASSNGYFSGEIQSRASYGFGYFEARLKAAAGPGVDTGFFLYTGPSSGHQWNEVDVEILGKNTRSVQLTYHTGNDQRPATVALPFDAAAESHTFGFDWQRNYIRWYVDGALVHEELGATLALPNEPQQIIFDLWNSDSLKPWLGPFSWPGRPITAQLQCVATAAKFPGRSLC